VVASRQMLCCLCPYVFSEGYVLMSILVFLVSCAGCAILHYMFMLIARFITPTAPALTFLYYEHLRTAQEQD
jgi:hypothetical protein